MSNSKQRESDQKRLRLKHEKLKSLIYNEDWAKLTCKSLTKNECFFNWKKTIKYFWRSKTRTNEKFKNFYHFHRTLRMKAGLKIDNRKIEDLNLWMEHYELRNRKFKPRMKRKIMWQSSTKLPKPKRIELLARSKLFFFLMKMWTSWDVRLKDFKHISKLNDICIKSSSKRIRRTKRLSKKKWEWEEMHFRLSINSFKQF